MQGADQSLNVSRPDAHLIDGKLERGLFIGRLDGAQELGGRRRKADYPTALKAVAWTDGEPFTQILSTRKTAR